MGFVKDAWNGITGKTGAKAAEKAGNLQADSSKYAADIAQRQFEQTRQDQMPWLNAGKNALGQLQGYVGADKGYNDIYGGALQQGIAGLAGNQVGGNNFNAFQSQAGQAIAGQSQAGQAIAGQSQAAQAQGGQSTAAQAQGGQSQAFNGQSFGNLSVDKFADKMRSQIQSNYDAGKYTGGLSLDDFEVDPSYQFRKAEGAAGLESSAAAGGSLLSGAALKSLNRYNSDLASQEYGNAWQRDQAQKQQLFGVDTGIRGQDLSVFADGANRKFAADSANAQMNQNNSQFNANQNQQNSQYNAQLGQQNSQFNANQLQQNSQFNADRFQNNSQFNANQNQQNSQYNAQLGQQNSQFNANQFQQNSQYNAQLGQQNSQFNAGQNQQNSQFNANQQQSAASTNANLNQNAQLANQSYGLNALGTLMNARSQDYNLFSGEDSRRYNQYANMAGVGQQAANTLGQFGAQNAGAQGDYAINGANMQANALMGAAGAKTGAWNGLLGLGMKAGGFI